ncbi:hypothetical protein Tco_0120706 [Tanacetum coccineum]
MENQDSIKDRSRRGVIGLDVWLNYYIHEDGQDHKEMFKDVWDLVRPHMHKRAALMACSLSDTQMENQEWRLQITEARRARLDLAKSVASMRRGQEPRQDSVSGSVRDMT